jgi:hypothetical protein
VFLPIDNFAYEPRWEVCKGIAYVYGLYHILCELLQQVVFQHINSRLAAVLTDENAQR